jgi:hypothetical protein
MADLYADEDFSLPVAEQLRALGHDVLTASESGHSDQAMADDEILDFAISQQRAVMTFNRRDFIRLHKNSSAHFGIIACTRDNDVAALAKRIDAAVAAEGDMRGKLLRIYRPSK